MTSTGITEAIRFKEACEKAAEISFLTQDCKDELLKAAKEIDSRITKAIDEIQILTN